MVRRWRNAAHVARWWPLADSSPQAIERKYLPRIDGSHPCRCFVILVDAVPVGLIQTYRVSDWPELAAYCDEPEVAAAVDIFIGNRAYLYRGHGPRAIRAFLRDVVFQDPSITCCYLNPSLSNQAARRAYEKAGLREVKRHLMPDGSEPEVVMRIDRNEFL